MSENLVIVESPGKIGKISSSLGKDYTVMASKGHIRDLPADKLSVDVSGSFEPTYVIPADKKKIVESLRSAAEKAGTVWLASDEDREGEAISWHLFETLKLDPAKTRRITFHEITKPALLEAVKHPREIDMNLVMAQQARRVLDRLVGYELSPVLWKKIKSGLSAGRVQSAVLRLVVDREREISAFEAEKFFKVEGIFTVGDTQIKATLDTKFASEEEAQAFLEKCKDAEFTVSDVSRKEGVRTPGAPFTTSQMQQDASRKLGFSVKQTMSTAQKLYEEGLITYMRTDSVNLSGLAVNSAKKVIADTWGEEYSKPRKYKTKSMGAQEAHEAIRPTYIENTEIEGSPAERKLYSLIWKRTVASQMADARIEKTVITISGSNFEEKFTATGERVLFDGFLKLYMGGKDDGEDEETGTVLPAIEKGSISVYKKITATESHTQAPARYSEGTLIKKMEELGIGRPSTYATTVTTIIDRGYVLKGDKPAVTVNVRELSLENGKVSSTVKAEKGGAEKKKLFPENIGILITDYLARSFPDIIDYNFTAKVEDEFDKIASGSEKWNEMIGHFYSGFHTGIDRSLAGKVQKNERELGTDPATGKRVYARMARYGAVVQLGENEDGDKKFAGLEKGQLIETVTLEEALRLLSLPRTVGRFGEKTITAAIGKLGPYVKYDGDDGKAKFVSIPPAMNPYDITEEEAIKLIESQSEKAKSGPLAEFPGAGIQIFNGRFGPYIKAGGVNYRIPRGTDPAAITEEEALAIVGSGKSTSPARKTKWRAKKDSKA